MNKRNSGILIFIVLHTLFITSTFATAEALKFVTQDFAPFSYQVDNVVSGPAADIIREICSAMEMECSLRSYSWNRAQKMVKDGKAHGMFVIGWTHKRAEWLYFTPPLMRAEYGFFVRNENLLQFKSPADIKGYTIGVYGPSNTSRCLEEITSKTENITTDLRPDDESGFRKLSRGRIDAVYSNRSVGYALLKKMGIGNIRYAGAHKQLNYYIGFSQAFTDRKLVDRFNAKFLELHKQGVIGRILERYHMDPADMKP